MEPYIAEFINNKNIPKFLRYILVIGVSSFIEFIFIKILLKNISLISNIVSIIIVLLFMILEIYLLIKVHKS